MKAWSNAPGVLVKVFLDHPQSLNETYWQHQRRALHFGSLMIGAGVACIIHALVPALFVRTASMTVQSLYREMHATRRLAGTSRLEHWGSLGPRDVGRMAVDAASVSGLARLVTVSPPHRRSAHKI